MQPFRGSRRNGPPTGCACALHRCRRAPDRARAFKCWRGWSRCPSPPCPAATIRRGAPSSRLSGRRDSHSARRACWNLRRPPVSSACGTVSPRASAKPSMTPRLRASPSRSPRACAATCQGRRTRRSVMRASRICSRFPACIWASWRGWSSRRSEPRWPCGRAWRSATRSRNGRPRRRSLQPSSTCFSRVRPFRRSAPSSWLRSPCWRFWWTVWKSACGWSRWRRWPCWSWSPMRSPPRVSNSPSRPLLRWLPFTRHWPRRSPKPAPARGARCFSWRRRCLPPWSRRSRQRLSQRTISAALPLTGSRRTSLPFRWRRSGSCQRRFWPCLPCRSASKPGRLRRWRPGSTPCC